MKRLILLSIAIYALFILGLSSLNATLVALAVPLLIYLAAALFYRPGPPELEAERVLSAHKVNEETPVRVTLTLTNAGEMGLDEVWVRDALPPGLTVEEGETEARVTLPPGETLTLTYTVRGLRGNYRFRDVRVVAQDHLGLLRRRRRLEVPGHLLVMPEVLRLKQVAIRPLRTRGYAGPIPSRLSGSGVEFFGVREYQLGDPLRRINWRASARDPRTLFTNEFEQERIADVGLILDARQQTDVHIGAHALFEHGVRATAALADAFLKDGNRVGLLIYGRGLERTFPGYGKVQRARILQALAYAKTGDSQVFENLDYLPTRFFPSNSQLVLVSPLAPDDQQVLIRLRAHGYQVLVVSPDAVAFEARLLTSELGQDPEAVALAARIAHIERNLVIRKLRRVGIQVVDWAVDRPFDKIVHASLGRPPRPARIVRIET